MVFAVFDERGNRWVTLSTLQIRVHSVASLVTFGEALRRLLGCVHRVVIADGFHVVCSSPMRSFEGLVKALKGWS